MFFIRVISDSDEARNVWSLLSPKSNIYEDWDFRYTFYKYFNYPLRFIVGEAEGQIVGVLPLQENTDRGYLEFFGGSFMEDNHVLIRPGYEKHIPEFYGAISQRAQLEDIVRDNEYLPLEFMENKYIIDLQGLNSLEDYLSRTFSSKTRGKFRKLKREAEELCSAVVENNYADIATLIALNRKSFGAESSFNSPRRCQGYHDLARSKAEVIMFSAQVGSKKECVSFDVKYGDIYVAMNTGTNKSDFEDLGSFLLLKKIEKAISLKCRVFDAGVGDLGWKESWHLTGVAEYKFSHEI